MPLARLRGVAKEAESGRGWRSRPSFSAVSGGGESPEPAGSNDGGEAAPGLASQPCPPRLLRATCQDARGVWAPGTSCATDVWEGVGRGGGGDWVRVGGERGLGSGEKGPETARGDLGARGTRAGVAGELRTCPPLPYRS